MFTYGRIAYYWYFLTKDKYIMKQNFSEEHKNVDSDNDSEFSSDELMQIAKQIRDSGPPTQVSLEELISFINS